MHNHKHRNLIIIGIVLLAILSAVAIYFFSRHSPTYSTASVTRRDLTAIVRATGSIVPDQSSSLSFSAQGKIQNVRVHTGDVVHKGDLLAQLDSRTTQAQLDGALADEASAAAQLAKIENGARPEEVAIYSQKYSDASSALFVAMNNAYLQAYDAITNKSDTLFSNGNSVNPSIIIYTQSGTTQQLINQERVTLNDTIINWRNTLASVASTASSSTSINQITVARTTTRNALASTQKFLNDLSVITNNLSTGNSGLSQTTINAYMSLINGANQEVTAASNGFTTSDATWSSARDSLTLENAGAQSQDVSSAAATLAKAQAEVEGYQSALSQSSILAPFDGTITEVNMKIGEVVVPGLSAGENISIISTDTYDINVYIPENAIGSLNAGNPAAVTLDAYGSGAIFPATVYLVNPAETVINGANSYKVTLRFNQPDTRIRSGLTINAVITTATTTNSIAVPSRALITRNAQKFVLLKDQKGSFVEKAVTTGITGSDGYTQILEGLNEGDVIASFGAENY